MASGDLFKGFPVRFSMKNMQHVKVLEKFEEIPEKGESFTYKNLTVSVNETDSRRVLSVRIKVEENAEHNDNGE